MISTVEATSHGEPPFETQLAGLLAPPVKGAPRELFGDAPDDFWLWINTEGYRGSSALRELLPGLPNEQVQRRFTNLTGDETLAVGFEIYRLVRALYERHVGEIADAQGILDFGCGYGRVIRFFLRDVDPQQLKGAEYDASLVDFCRTSNRWCSFVRTDAGPPLPFPDDEFSLVYVWSVFSHFSEPMHRRWLEELRRVLRPGGGLAISVRPRAFIEYLGRIRAEPTKVQHPILLEMFPEPDAELQRYDAGEFCFAPYDRSRPDAWWGETFIPRAYVEREWGGLFDLAEFIDASPPLDQHMVVLKK